jgi:hypothetical protein
MKKTRLNTGTILGLSLALSITVAAMISCGSSSTSSNTPTTGTVQTFLSDPPTCSAYYDHVYVTITKVEANISATSNSGWQTLVDLTSAPKQVDLMTLNPSATPNFCGTLYLLAQQQLPPGKYQQIRLILLANDAASGPSNNACSAGFNCVVPHGSSTSYELDLSSEAQTGIKIPASQIANGGLTVTAGQNTDFNIDFDSCASIVQEGNGQYRLKPVLHAGEVSLNNSVISGKAVDSSSGAAIPNALVLLEQPDPNDATTDRVVMSGMTGSDGSFSFCPLPASNTNFDIVVAGQVMQSGTVPSTTTYNPTILFAVPIGANVGNIPLYAETATTSLNCTVGSTCPGTISGQITSTNSGTPVAGSVEVSALQSVTNGSTTIKVTIPVFMATSQPPDFTTNSTTPTAGCATASADCTAYSLSVPASSPAIGTYSTSSISFTAPTSTSQASYTVNALADGSNGLMTCSPTSMTSNSVTVNSGSTVTSSSEPTLNFAFTGCTAP